MDALIEDFDSTQLKKDIPHFEVGDTVRVSTRIVEGEKERVQVFEGTVIARKGNKLSETFSLHRVSYGEGMERVFYLHSPRIVKIAVVKKGHAKRAKLYHLRGKTGKAAKIKEKIGVNRSKLFEQQRAQPIEEEIESEEMATASEPETVESSSKE